MHDNWPALITFLLFVAWLVREDIRRWWNDDEW